MTIINGNIASSAPRIVKSGLTVYLDASSLASYPQSGTTWTDLSGNGNNGTLTNGPIYNSERSGSIKLDGTDDYINFNMINPFAETIIVWARSLTTNWTDFGLISSSRRQNGHIIHTEAYGRNTSFYFLDSSTGYYKIGETGNVADITVPHMYAMTTNGSNLHKGYLDGSEVCTSSTSITRTGSPSSQNWCIGKDDTFGRYLNGHVYHALRYNRQLTAAEISQNFNAVRKKYGL